MFQNLKISTRFILVIVGLLFSCFIAMFLGYYLFTVSEYEMNNIYHGGVEDNFLLNRSRDNFEEKILRNTYKINNQNTISEFYPEMKEGIAKGKELWDTYLINAKKWIETETPEHQSLINRTQQLISDVSLSVDRLQQTNEQTRTQALSELSVQTDNLLKQMRAITKWNADDSANDYKAAMNTFANARNVSVVIFIVTQLVLILFVIWISLSILRPLRQAVEFINKLTIGDLTCNIENTAKHEIGQLLDAMKSLNVSSKNVASTLTSVSNGDLTISFEPRSEQDSLGIALVTMIKNLRLIIGEIQEQVTSLTSSAQEIASTISQVATSSSETAAAVTETTTSVEELKQTAHVTDEKAKDVLNSSEDTLQTVSSSEKFLQTTMDDMKQINDKMRGISEGIVKLSEHSKTIGDIIDSVNDLAEQSNLLAVNAAIEAAKAGEHGKSFAVVAQEIRTLAEQSKAATIQVRSILNEIQNATSSAVLATEQGAKAVEKGVKQSAETNESMQVLSQSITRVTQYANQIALSSQQQFVGIDQVTIAMNNISSATGLLVDHMRQIETSISSLNNVGENLKDMTYKYVLSKENVPFSVSKKKSGKS